MCGAAIGSTIYFIGRKIRVARDSYCAWSYCVDLFDRRNLAALKKGLVRLEIAPPGETRIRLALSLAS
jgi:hypothetical protein